MAGCCRNPPRALAHVIRVAVAAEMAVAARDVRTWHDAVANLQGAAFAETKTVPPMATTSRRHSRVHRSAGRSDRVRAACAVILRVALAAERVPCRCRRCRNSAPSSARRLAPAPGKCRRAACRYAPGCSVTAARTCVMQAPSLLVVPSVRRTTVAPPVANAGISGRDEWILMLDRERCRTPAGVPQVVQQAVPDKRRCDAWPTVAKFHGISSGGVGQRDDQAGRSARAFLVGITTSLPCAWPIRLPRRCVTLFASMPIQKKGLGSMFAAMAGPSAARRSNVLIDVVGDGARMKLCPRQIRSSGCSCQARIRRYASNSLGHGRSTAVPVDILQIGCSSAGGEMR